MSEDRFLEFHDRTRPTRPTGWRERVWLRRRSHTAVSGSPMDHLTLAAK